MNKKIKSNTLLMIIHYSSSQMVLQGLKIFREKYGDYFSDIKIFYVEEIESSVISEEIFGTALESADLVLIDVRSNRVTARILKERLTNRTDVNVVTLLGAGMELMKLNRLGTFHMGKFMSKFVKDKKHKSKIMESEDIEVLHKEKKEKTIDFKKIFLIQKIIKFFGTIIPFGGFKHSKRIIKLMEWWQSENIDNFICILELIASKYMGLKIERKKRQKPRKYHHAGFWRPDLKDFRGKLKRYLRRCPLKPQLPTLLVIFYGGLHFQASVSVVKRIFEKYSDSWNIIAFYTDGIFTINYLNKFINPKKIPFDAVLSLIWFPFNGGAMGGDLEETHNVLTKWNVPIFLGIGLYNQQYKDFLNRKEGLTPVQILATLIFPEMDGLIDGIPLLSTKSEEVTIGTQQMNLITPYVFENNLELMFKRIKARIELKNLDNSEKKLVFILYNYPPGEAGIGNAAYFDSIVSITQLFEELGKNGYSFDYPKNFDLLNPSQLKDWMIANGFVNSPKWFTLKDIVTKLGDPSSRNDPKLIKVSKERYLKWYQALDINLRKTVEKIWGPPPGKLYVVNDNLYLPIAKFGNIYLGIQPSRGDFEDLENLYHDQTLPPHHEYLCFYYYILNEIKAHALIHLGTHGTLEFLPGKEVGLKREFCYNHSMMDYIPHFYIYQISNTSEAMIAKRRSLGTLISYQLPPFIDSGLDSAFGKLEEQIHLLKEAELMDNPSVKESKEEILKEAKERGFTISNIKELEKEIVKCKTSLIPEGLHVFGKGYTLNEAVNYLWTIQPMIPHRPNLYELIANEFDLPKRAKENLAAYVNENIKDPKRNLIKTTGLKIIRQILLGKSIKDIKSMFPDLEFLSEPTLPLLMQKMVELGKNSMQNFEILNLLNGLNGTFIPPRMGGDPIRTPNVLPSGYNLFQFNPQLIPTDMAVKRGKQAAEQTIDLYRKNHNGEYPKNIAVVLWGFETAKTHGEAIGQILSYLGVKISELTSWRREPELIPLSELGRPRINVTINICGFMRDLFSHVLEMLDEAIDLVIDADESLEDNYVKAQYMEIRNELLKRGKNENNADTMARFRIFGPDASEYGSILPTLIESGAWKKPEELGEIYMKQMQFAYRRNTRAKPSIGIFKKQLESLDIITQVRDTVAYAVTDLDHYYEFIGGLYQASNVVGNKKPPSIFVTDTTTVKVETATLKTTINRGVITRTANPKWVKGMLKHDYSGGKKVSNNVNYLLGFAATTRQVEDETWNQVYNTMIANEEIQEALKKNNIYAFHDLLKTLLEAIQRNLWNASEEQEKKLQDLCLELEEYYI
ncbi:MAG: cobaltochelatase subunit CobN [Candidatus Helarchaeota archaeon]